MNCMLRERIKILIQNIFIREVKMEQTHSPAERTGLYWGNRIDLMLLKDSMKAYKWSKEVDKTNGKI